MTLALRLTRLQVCHNGNSVLLWQQYLRYSSTKSQERLKSDKVEKPPESTETGKFTTNLKLKEAQHIPKPPNWPEDNKLLRDHCDGKESKAGQNLEQTSSGKSQPKSKLSREAVRQNVKGYVFTRYFDYVKNYDKVLEKNFPSAVKVYRVFFDGVKDFYSDMKRYLKISRIANASPDGLKALNRKELELYMQMPRDMVKVAPALIFSSLPMVGYLIFPLVFMYPRTFLTSHFWTLQQRHEFRQIELKERLHCNRSALRCLQAKLKTIRKHEKYEEMDNILGLLGSGFHPTVDAILSVKDIFAEVPYSLMSLSGRHIKVLHQMHGLKGWWFKRHRLREHAFLIHHMDLAVGREGGVHNMLPEAMRYSCFIRGLNPNNLSNDDMVEWLRNWIKISTSIQEQHISLFMHLPILLGYNHPNNWQLIYSEKSK